MDSGEQWIYSRLLTLVGSSSSPLGTPYCYCLSKLSLPIQPFWQPTNVGFELHLYWLQNEEIHSHWHLSLFPYRDLRPYKISPYVAFCTSLPPELELEAELLTYSSFFPVSNRKRIGRGLGNGTRKRLYCWLFRWSDRTNCIDCIVNRGLDQWLRVLGSMARLSRQWACLWVQFSLSITKVWIWISNSRRGRPQALSFFL